MSLGADVARLLNPEDLSHFAVVLEGDEDPGADDVGAVFGGALAEGDEGHQTRSIRLEPKRPDGLTMRMRTMTTKAETREVDEPDRWRAGRIFAEYAEVDEEASVVAVGNIHGQGELLLEHLEHLGALR